MIETVLVAIVALGIAVLIRAIGSPQVVPAFLRKGEVIGLAPDQTAKCVTASTRCWCHENELAAEIPSGEFVPERGLTTAKETNDAIMPDTHGAAAEEADRRQSFVGPLPTETTNTPR